MAIAPIQTVAGIGNFMSLSKASSEVWLDRSEKFLLVFGLLVGVGIIGEIFAEHEAKQKLSNRKMVLFGENENLRPASFVSFWKKHKHFFEILVLIGVCGEFICDGGIWLFGKQLQIISDRETGIAIKEAALANERSSNTESNNLVLRSNVVALEIKLQPRRITPEQKEKFISFLSKYPKGPVKVFIGRQDDELLDYTKHIREILDDAGYGTGNDHGVIVLGDEVGYYSPIGDTHKVPSVWLLFYQTNTSTLSWPGIWFFGTTNRLASRNDDPRGIPAFIQDAFFEIHIEIAPVTTTNHLNPGDWGVFVRQKY